MRNFLTNRAGFTIIELLVVIIVIATLATIIVATYQNVQVKARNAQTAQAVQQYRKALLLYKTEHGEYPLDGNSCIGTGYSDLNGDGSADCRYGNIDGGGFTVHSDSQFTEAMQPYLNASASRPAARIETSGENIMVGAYFSGTHDPNYAPNIDGNPVLNWIAYVVEGQGATCPVGPVYAPDYSQDPPAGSEQWDDFRSPPADHSFSEGNGVQCWLPLPNP